MARYLAVSCDLPGVSDERLACLLEGFSVLGASLEGGEGIPFATIFLAPDAGHELALLESSLVGLGAERLSVATVESRDWIAAYRRQARPFAVGERWWIDPGPHGETVPPEGRIRLSIEPSTAFGSGTHESTQLALLALQDLMVAGRSVLDVGTGSGILAVAAEALGASPVLGLDLDPGAVWTAWRALRQQDWAARPLLIVATMAAVGDRRFDVVLCNMMSSEVIPLLPDLARVLAPRGKLILSGSLVAERAMVRGEIERVGLGVIRESRLGEWSGWTVGHG